MTNVDCTDYFPVRNCYIGLGIIDKVYFKELCKKVFVFTNGELESTMNVFNYAAIGWSSHLCLIFFQLQDEIDETEILSYLGISEYDVMQIYDPDISMEEMSVDVLYMEEHYIADMFRSYNVILGS